MRIYGVHAQDLQGVGGALRGQEMAYALQKMGHTIIQRSAHQNIREALRSKPGVDAVILTGTWHQLLAGNSSAVLIADACDEYAVPCLWWYGSNGAIWAQPDPSPTKRAESTKRILDLIMERPFIGVIAPYSMRIYERYGIPRSKMRLVPSVFDGDLFHPAERPWEKHVAERLRFKFGIPPKAWCIGTVGTIPHSKGGDEMIRAIAIAAKEMPDLHYVLLHTPPGNLSAVKALSPDGQTVGNSERDVLFDSQRLAKRLGVGNRVHFLPTRFMRVGMPGFYWMLNAYASPSLADNLPQPPVEAQLCGLPFLTHTSAFTDEFCFDFVSCPETAVRVDPAERVTDDYGLIIPYGDPERLADGIRTCRELSQDKDAAAHTRAWAYEKFHHHNAQRMIDVIEEMRGLLRAREQVRVGDQGDDMRIGYAHAAERIETEIGKPGRKILDIGCNIGAGMDVLAECWPASRIFGIEPVNRFAEIARGTGRKVETACAEKLPYTEDSFHLVFARHSLEHCTSRALAMSEFHRILVPGGCLYVQAPIEVGGTKNDLHLTPFVTAAEVRALGDGPEWEEVYWGPQETVAELILRKVERGAST